MICGECSNSLLPSRLVSSESALLFLERHGCLMPKLGHNCPRCGNSLTFHDESHSWRCYGTFRNPKTRKSVRCNYKSSRYTGTWLSGTRIKPETTLLFVQTFLQNLLTVAYAEDNLSIARTAYADCGSYIREVCLRDVAASSTLLGDPGTVVEVDETLLGRRKNNVGRSLMGQWVLGGIERGSRKVFLLVIPDRSADTLIRCIKKHVLPGTTVITDCWKGYASLHARAGYPGYHHLTVNHSENFVDPTTGAHTQNIEREWRHQVNCFPE